MKKELYFCVRFSDKFSNKLGDKGIKDLKKKWDVEALPSFKKLIQGVDPEAKVWIKVY